MPIIACYKGGCGTCIAIYVEEDQIPVAKEELWFKTTCKNFDHQNTESLQKYYTTVYQER